MRQNWEGPCPNVELVATASTGFDFGAHPNRTRNLLSVISHEFLNSDWFFIDSFSGKVCNVELGEKLPALEFLTITGVQWRWNAVSSILKCASEVKELVMKIEFTGDNAFQPFPEIDFVEFFNNHPKLCKFEIHGAMFAALCQRNSLRSVSELNIKQVH